ncbi:MULTISPECIES: NAD(P)/FAD-dependent oxidoreductase [Deefgea]|uniref:Aminoacetone oxidase family FAD-binding enzyme n=1 Tax=Deefgea chitinilytica TaxID=570276 RepID=A0ABS2CA81_9NEIS|nr:MULTISPECIES: NAD(P)/FAD-dependent oxidoreductase [Deefgea]MBM5571040.1 aminoacetone oxidase family FAD-binding enzyme [Deefgea chitinilytica]MBM9888270.1 NAD(P)/FAD-dependent oxidoreductase [Deefgea sp. CFH1-16]
MLKTDVVIIGAGAAGLMCAATAGQRGRSVVLIDHSKKLAEKIRISGGGRCNFTNLNVRPECYISNNPHFVKSALKQYTQHDFIALVERHGLTYHEKTLGQLFCDQNSQGIIDMLKAEVDLGEVTWRMGTSVLQIKQIEGGFVVTTPTEVWQCESLVIASGGLSIPQIGATALGYEIAKQFGLKIVPLAAALVPLTFQAEDLWTELAGVALENVVVSCENTAFREDILLTHKGVSGPAILQISSFWDAGKVIEIDLLPDVDLEDFFRAANRDSLLSNVLAEILPKRFLQVWLAKYGEIRPLKQYSLKELQLVAADLHHWQIKPSGTVGYKKAEVTRGGVDTDQLLSKTMMVRSVPGLYFIGEVVDVTGWLGGYNFQWAWSSGYVAGLNI